METKPDTQVLPQVGKMVEVEPVKIRKKVYDETTTSEDYIKNLLNMARNMKV